MFYGIPEVYPDHATGKLSLIYKDILQTLKVPVVNFIFRTLAWYDTFLEMAWNQMVLNLLTEEKAQSLRTLKFNYQIPNIDWKEYYSIDEIQLLSRIVETFNYVNPKLLIIATAWKEALSNRIIKGTGELSQIIPPGISSQFPPIHLVDMNRIPMDLFDLLEDIIKTHHTFDAASDFRTLANFPTFLKISWSYLKPFVGTDE